MIGDLTPLSKNALCNGGMSKEEKRKKRAVEAAQSRHDVEKLRKLANVNDPDEARAQLEQIKELPTATILPLQSKVSALERYIEVAEGQHASNTSADERQDWLLEQDKLLTKAKSIPPRPPHSPHENGFFSLTRVLPTGALYWTPSKL